MDWLEAYSPMQVHWRLKWLAIPYEGRIHVLQGQLPDAPDQILLQLAVTDSEPSSSADPVPVPPPVSQLLDEFSDIFTPPTSLPPPRACNHEIPPIPGAQQVFIRPY